MSWVIWGTGAIGGTIGAYWRRAGIPVDWVDADHEHVKVIREKGLTIEGPEGTFTAEGRIWHPDEIPPSQLWEGAFLAVKGQHTLTAMNSLLPHLRSGGWVVSLQNGLLAQVIRRELGFQDVLPALVDFSADVLAPGVIHYASPGDIVVGELDGSMSSRLETVVELLRQFAPGVKATSEIEGYQWAKVGYGAMLFATALVDETMANVIDAYPDLMLELAREVYRVAAALGVQVKPFDAIEADLWASDAPKEDLYTSLRCLTAWQRTSPKVKSGIWRDLAVRKRRTEVDVQLGEVLRLADSLGLKVPLLRHLVRQIHELETGERVMTWANVEELDLLRREPAFVRIWSFLSVPSISSDPGHAADIEKTARWVAATMRELGLAEAEVHETTGHPVVIGKAKKGRANCPTVLVYGHYDVQPPGDLGRWSSPPFSPRLLGDRVVARGASDDKIPFFQALWAWYLEGRDLPVQVIFLCEGEEEIGSPSLPAFLDENRELLQADVVISADGAMWRPDEPSLITSARGLVALELRVKTAARDLHSGRYGGAVPNALQVLAHILAALHDSEGRVAVPGFYEGISELSAAEKAALAEIPFDACQFLADVGSTVEGGERGYSLLEKIWYRPTLEIHGIGGGHAGPGVPTVVPSEAWAKLSCRLVEGQDPEEILSRVEGFLYDLLPEGVEMEVRRLPGSSRAYSLSRSNPYLQAAARALEGAYGAAPLYVGMGGTLPAADVFRRTLGVDTIFFSFSTSDEQFHGPNEFFRLRSWQRGLEAWRRLYCELTVMGRKG